MPRVARVARCECGATSGVLDMPEALRDGFASHVYEIHVARYAAAWHDAHVHDNGRRVGVYVSSDGHEKYSVA